MLTRWPAFTRFLDDGRICLSNNAAERALRGVALGRRSWLFAGSDRGGERAAAMYTSFSERFRRRTERRLWVGLQSLPYVVREWRGSAGSGRCGLAQPAGAANRGNRA